MDTLRLDTKKSINTHTHTPKISKQKTFNCCLMNETQPFIQNKKTLQSGDENRLFQFLFYVLLDAIDSMKMLMKTTWAWKNVTYLPILVSSSSSDGARLFRRHSVAIIPMCNVKQHTKSMISSNRSTAPTATAMRDADVTWLGGTMRSRPKKMVTKKHRNSDSIDFCCFVVVLGNMVIISLLFRMVQLCVHVFELVCVWLVRRWVCKCVQVFITEFFCFFG